MSQTTDDVKAIALFQRQVELLNDSIQKMADRGLSVEIDVRELQPLQRCRRPHLEAKIDVAREVDCGISWNPLRRR